MTSSSISRSGAGAASWLVSICHGVGRPILGWPELTDYRPSVVTESSSSVTGVDCLVQASGSVKARHRGKNATFASSLG